MRPLLLYAKALIKHWLTLMGCAGFTFLTIVLALLPNQVNVNVWFLRGSGALAITFFGCASYLAWKDQYDRYETQLDLYQEELNKNAQPALRGEFFDFEMEGENAGPETYSFSASVCNLRPITTSIHSIKLTVEDCFGKAATAEGPAMIVGGGTVVLAQGIERTVYTTMELPASGYLAKLVKVSVIDSFGVEHTLTQRDPIPGINLPG